MSESGSETDGPLKNVVNGPSTKNGSPIFAGDQSSRSEFTSDDTTTVLANDRMSVIRRLRSRPTFWRSPGDQPRWARPALLATASLATLSYAWGINNFPLESFYAAAARSMGSSWRDFFFGAVDPAGTVTLDKLPGAFWLQALSVRLFGFHYWSVALPQVLAGALTVLIIYRVVRLLAGPLAGLLAAVIMTFSPVTALLNRGNVADSVLVLLTVLAADATVRAIKSGRFRTLLLVGLWIGLAFQTKMLQAWLILPPLFLAYLLTGPASARRRLSHIVAAGALMIIVSVSWISVVSAIPGHDRPYIDGTTDNSPYVQVFVYNGWARVGVHWDSGDVAATLQPFQLVAHEENPQIGTFQIKASINRLLVGPFGRDDAWLFPAAVVSALGLLVARRSKGRTDLLRAGVILWGGWLVTLWAFFSFGVFINSYYTAALIPAVAALGAMGFVECWNHRATNRNATIVLFVLVPVTTLYALILVPSTAGIRWWLVPLTFVACVVAELLLATSMYTRVRHHRQPSLAVVVAGLSMLLVPAVTTGVVVASGDGSFSTPYQSAAATIGMTVAPKSYQSKAPTMSAYWDRFPSDEILQAVDTSFYAAPLIMVTGREFLPIGGVSGSNPSPTLDRLRYLIKTGRLSSFLIPIHPAGSDPRLVWVRSKCQKITTLPYGSGVTFAIYVCGPQDL